MWEWVTESGMWKWIVTGGAGLVALRWLGKAGWESIKSRIERGRRRVEEARPELIPLGGTTPRLQIGVRLENRGRGAARNTRVRFTGTRGEAIDGEIAAGAIGLSGNLDTSANPAYRVRQDNLLLTVLYADRFGNDYTVTVRAAQTPRADEQYNVDFPWTQYQHHEPRLGWRDYYRIGR